MCTDAIASICLRALPNDVPANCGLSPFRMVIETIEIDEEDGFQHETLMRVESIESLGNYLMSVA